MPLYSHNRLSVYETCARQYRFQYLDRLEVPDGAGAIRWRLDRLTTAERPPSPS